MQAFSAATKSQQKTNIRLKMSENGSINSNGHLSHNNIQTIKSKILLVIMIVYILLKKGCLLGLISQVEFLM